MFKIGELGQEQITELCCHLVAHAELCCLPSLTNEHFPLLEMLGAHRGKLFCALSKHREFQTAKERLCAGLFAHGQIQFEIQSFKLVCPQLMLVWEIHVSVAGEAKSILVVASLVEKVGASPSSTLVQVEPEWWNASELNAIC